MTLGPPLCLGVYSPTMPIERGPFSLFAGGYNYVDPALRTGDLNLHIQEPQGKDISWATQINLTVNFLKLPHRYIILLPINNEIYLYNT